MMYCVNVDRNSFKFFVFVLKRSKWKFFNQVFSLGAKLFCQSFCTQERNSCVMLDE